MMKEFGTKLRISIMFTLVLTVLTGLIYPAVITIAGKALFPHQAEGSLITVDGKVVGSELIGQPFDAPQYFWGRPSATGPYPYNASNSSGSNLGPTNQALLDAVKGRVDALRKADPDNKSAVPIDLVTASASGLDPHISPAAAEYQALRVARARKLEPSTVADLVRKYTEPPTFGFLGEPRVNVLKLNLALDALAPTVK